jgi:hypothetical protein
VLGRRRTCVSSPKDDVKRPGKHVGVSVTLGLTTGPSLTRRNGHRCVESTTEASGSSPVFCRGGDSLLMVALECRPDFDSCFV